MIPWKSLTNFILTAAFLGAGPVPIHAQQPSFAAKGKSGDLSFIAAISNDPNWIQEWTSPKNGTPRIAGSSIVSPGDSLFFIALFSGAQTQNGRAELDCALTIFPPGQQPSIKLDRTPCFGETISDKTLLNLADFFPRIQIPSDEATGFLRAESTIWDKLSGESISLEIGVQIQ